MRKVKLAVRDLNPPAKVIKGSEIVSKSTNNPRVPGNAAYVQAFQQANDVLMAAVEATANSVKTTKELRAAQDAAEEAWMVAVVNLGSYTQAATGGDPEAILSTGLDIAKEPGAPQPVGTIQNLRVSLNGHTGVTRLRWDADPHAISYVIECGPDGSDESTFKYVATVPESKFEAEGAKPGEICWFRVAGINRLGQGGWSNPGMRPVM